MVRPGDVVLAISHSGESDELAAILPAIRRLGVVLVAMTGRAESSLARHADHVVLSAVDAEACPLNLAPTASTAAQMALGDALAVALLDARGFREDDFARSHPGGALGRKLLMHVHDLMRHGDAVPRVGPDEADAALDPLVARLGSREVTSGDELAWLDSYHAILAMVAAGAGWTILTPLGVLRAQRFVRDVDIVELPFTPFSRRITLSARRGVLGDLPEDVAHRLKRQLDRTIIQPLHDHLPWLAGGMRLL